MVDTLLLHHYQRLWKAEATPEILKTRPKSSSQLHSKPNGLTRNYSSVMSLCNSPYLPKRTLNIAAVPKQQQQRQKRRTQKRPEQPSSSSEDEAVLLRKAASMHDLSHAKMKHSTSDEGLVGVKLADKIDTFLETVSKQQEALTKLMEQRRIRRTSVNSRMSSMMTVQRKTTTSSASTSVRPQTVIMNKNQVKQQPLRPKSAAAPVQKRAQAKPGYDPVKVSSRPKSAAIVQKRIIQDQPPAYDRAKVSSRLTQDRNYQPPRRKQQSVQKELTSQDTLKTTNSAEDDYGGDDFEEDEEEDDDEDTDRALAKQKEAWLFDQAIRGRARQKAAEALKSSIQEKESSKDSAYGFSGGENSRLHTREPTPDANNYHVQPRIINHHYRGLNSRGPPPPVSQNASNKRKQFLSSLGTTTPSYHRRFNGNNPIPRPKTNPVLNHIVDRADTDKVEFLNKVTREILRKGVFSEKAIKRALDSQCCLHAKNETITVNDKVALTAKLKEDLGLIEKSHQKRTSMARSTSESSSLSSINNPNTVGYFDPILARSRDQNKNEEDDDDDELSSLLVDESDADLVAILKSVLRKDTAPKMIIENNYASPDSDEDEDTPRRKLPVASTSPGKLFESLNLSNLNVSFNSSTMAEAKRRLNESRTQALLVKSFAYQDADDNKAKAAPRPPLKRSTSTTAAPLDNEQADHDESPRDESVQDDLSAREESVQEGSNSAASEVIEDEDIPYESDLD